MVVPRENIEFVINFMLTYMCHCVVICTRMRVVDQADNESIRCKLCIGESP